MAGPYRKGKCSECGRSLPLRADGKTFLHFTVGRKGRKLSDQKTCPGSVRKPKE